MPQTEGKLILVTGRSGAGKDTLINGIRDQIRDRHRLVFAKRAITRPSHAGGEAHIAMTEAEFLAHKKRGDFWVDWYAHGLHYALPVEILHTLQSGVSVLANVSRTVTGKLAELWPSTLVIEIEAPAAKIQQRLEQRGRETHSDIQQRLQRNVPEPPQHIRSVKLENNESVAQGVARLYELVCESLPSAPTPNEASDIP